MTRKRVFFHMLCRKVKDVKKKECKKKKQETFEVD